MLISTSATVTNGKRSFGMLSLSGIIAARRGGWAKCSAEPTRLLAGGSPRALRLADGRQRPDAVARLGDVLVGVVGGANERAGRDMVEAELVGGALERGEL